MMFRVFLMAALAFGIVANSQGIAQACDAACQAARKAANPLADTKALMTDNTAAFRSGTNNDDSYNFQLQPVYAVPLSDANLVLRGIVPIQGVQPGAVLPPNNVTPARTRDLTWGIGDTSVQAFYAPTPGGKRHSAGFWHAGFSTHPHQVFIAGGGLGCRSGFCDVWPDRRSVLG